MLRGLFTAVVFTVGLTGWVSPATAQNTYPCSAESSLRSTQANTAITEFFENSSSQPITIYWLNYSGQRVLYYQVAPGATQQFGTFLTHPWIVINASGTCLGIWIFTANDQTAVVTDTPIGGGGGGGSSLQPSVAQLTFTGSAGGAAPGSQSFIISSTGSSVHFAITTDLGQTGTPSPPWLTVSPTGGATPALIIVSVDPGKLAANSYAARIVIMVPNDPSQQPVYVTVSFTVASSPPKLDVSPRSLSFRATAHAAGTLVRTVIVSNVGGGGADSFTVSIPDSIPGLTVTPTNGKVSPGSPVAVEVRINTQAAASAGYKGIVRFISSDSTILDVAVSLFVANVGPILSVDQTGMLFNYRQAQGLQLPQVIKVYDLGDPSSSVSFTAEVANGAPWLTLTPSVGTATPGKPATITATINTNAGQLVPSGYYALVRITDNRAQNSPQYVAVVLNVSAASTPPEPDPVLRGLVFIAKPGGPAQLSQNVKVYASSQTAVNFTASGSGAASVTVTPASGSITTSMPATLAITANTTGLIRGIYESRVDLEIGTVERSVNVTVIVVPSGGSLASRATAPASSCTPTRVVLTETGLPNGFSVPGGFPATLSTVMNDDCGNTITDGSVVATFSNGDPALSLVTDTSSGVYSATWQPGGTSAQTTVTMAGTSGTLSSDTIEITGGVSHNPSPPPVLAHGGTVNNVFPAGSLSPGAVAEVFGSGLASNQGLPKTVPLPTAFQGTSLLVGADRMPLFFISGGQVDAQIPWEIEPGQYSVIANVNGALSLPDTITVNPVQPAVVALGNGDVLAQHANGKLVKSTNPAKPGETVIIYLVGMGATNPAVVSGHPAPSSPLAKVVEQPIVTVDGQNAKVSFAGLTPGGVGLYQIDFKVPSNARNGDLDLVVAQNGIAGNTTKLIVAK